jgi:3-hydroxymyristoyl/3-hydroxydecanoyl-(acyl carrier protein) dehydratase
MNREEMQAYMPHRGRNLLIDEFRDRGEGEGEARLTIDEGDPLGREIFLARGPEGARYLPVFLVEHVALASLLVIRDEMRGGRLAYFSTISRFTAHAEAPAGREIRSRVSRGRDRGEFRSFTGRVETADGDQVLEVGIMAFLAPRDTMATGPAVPREKGEAPGGRAADPELFRGLHPSAVFVSPRGAAAPGGTYPPDHPHVPGHFPGAPVMMGMAQWLAVAQAAALTAPPGRSELSGSGLLARADGAPVAEVSGLRIAVERREDGRVLDLGLLATKRVAFRERIVPGDSYTVAFEPA